jgi:hypothetical protein
MYITLNFEKLLLSKILHKVLKITYTQPKNITFNFVNSLFIKILHIVLKFPKYHIYRAGMILFMKHFI